MNCGTSNNMTCVGKTKFNSFFYFKPGIIFYTNDLRRRLLGVFNGMDPNGVWSLYVSDLSAGGEGTLVGWGLEITAVPEPSAAALLGSSLAALLLLARPRKEVP